jgi:CHAT domain-containing protein
MWSTVKLMVGMIQAANNSKLSHGEALREATLAFLRNASEEELHPRMWAPFVVVGEPAKPSM